MSRTPALRQRARSQASWAVLTTGLLLGGSLALGPGAAAYAAPPAEPKPKPSDQGGGRPEPSAPASTTPAPTKAAAPTAGSTSPPTAAPSAASTNPQGKPAGKPSPPPASPTGQPSTAAPGPGQPHQGQPHQGQPQPNQGQPHQGQPAPAQPVPAQPTSGGATVGPVLPSLAPRPVSGPVLGPVVPEQPRSRPRAVRQAPVQGPGLPTTRPSVTGPVGTLFPLDDSTARRAFDSVSETLAVTTRDPELPLGILAAVAAFLVLQNRIDRRDPKLAAARGGRAGSDELEFRAPVRRPDPVRPRRPLARPQLRIVVPDGLHLSPSALPGAAT